MLLAAKDIFECKIFSDGGECGRVRDILFDDSTWIVRYVVLRTDFADSHVDLLLPHDTTYGIDPAARTMKYKGLCEDIKYLRPLDLDPPISRQQQLTRKAIRLFAPFYNFGQSWGAVSMSTISEWYLRNSSSTVSQGRDHQEAKYDPHLRSARKIIGYRVQALNGIIGRVTDIVINDTNHAIHSVIVEVRRWWKLARLILPVHYIRGISWATSRLAVGLDRKAVRVLKPYAPV
jgi:sporulation protein YlmC with PRC-barrel domain